MPVIIFLVLIGILLIAPAQADYYSQIMPIDISVEEKIKCERGIWESVKARNLEIPVETIKIKVKEGEKTKVKFQATISCESYLRVLLINQDGEISYCCFNSGKSIKGGGCIVKDEFSLPVGIYTCIFISHGNNGYGKENRGWIEFLIFCENLYKQKGHEQALKRIIDETAGALRSRDSVNIKKIIVGEDYSSGYAFLPAKSIKIQRCFTKEGKLKITGKTNLDDSDIAWIFKAEGSEINGQTKIKSDCTFDFVINCVGVEGDYSLTLEADDTSEFFTGKLPIKSPIKIQPAPMPRAISKPIPAPKIIPKSTQTPIIKITARPTISPIVIKNITGKQRVPAPTQTPKTNISIFLPIASIAIAVFLKKFRNAFD